MNISVYNGEIGLNFHAYKHTVDILLKTLLCKDKRIPREDLVRITKMIPTDISGSMVKQFGRPPYTTAYFYIHTQSDYDYQSAI